MASACRSAVAISKRSMCIRPNAVLKTLAPKPVPSSAFSSPARPFHSVLRFAPALGVLGTMLPLHSAIAAARLKSNLATNTTCWSWLSQGFATTL